MSENFEYLGLRRVKLMIGHFSEMLETFECQQPASGVGVALTDLQSRKQY